MEDELGREAGGIETKTVPGARLGNPLPVEAWRPLPVLPHPRPGLLSQTPAASRRWEEQGWQS